MGTGPKKWTEALIAQRVKDGRGQGKGVNYSPWLDVQEFSSKGTQTRVAGVKLHRTVHTFSYLERNLYLLNEFQATFVDYREQFAMDRSITLGAARTLNIRHPVYPKTSAPVVMTIDAIAEHRGPNGGTTLTAWDVKPARLLQNPRVMEKLSLHKAYCAVHSIDHRIFTEESVPKTVIRNIEWIRGAVKKEGEIETIHGLFDKQPNAMLEDLSRKPHSCSIKRYCGKYDVEHCFPVGTALRLFKILLWRHKLAVDLSSAQIESLPVPSPKFPPYVPAIRMVA